MSSEFEQLSSETVYDGRVAKVHKRRYRHADGEEVERDVVGHPGAVAVVAHDDRDLWLVRQPREAVEIPDLLELPAGLRDVEGEPPLETAKRELGEEIGKAAARWELLKSFHTSPGFSDELVIVYLATELSDAPDAQQHDERIDVVSHPLSELDRLIDDVTDSKTLVGLYALRRRLRP